jgi:hypothetical protein
MANLARSTSVAIVWAVLLMPFDSALAQEQCAPLAISQRVAHRSRLLDLPQELWPTVNGLPERIVALLRTRKAEADSIIVSELRAPSSDAWRWAVAWMIATLHPVTNAEASHLADLIREAQVPSRFMLGSGVENESEPYPQFLALRSLARLDGNALDSLLVRRMYCDALWTHQALSREPERLAYFRIAFQLEGIIEHAVRLLGE